MKDGEGNPVPIYRRPPIIGLILLAISVILHFTFPIVKLIWFPFNLIGIIGVVGGWLLAMWGKRTFFESGVELVPGSKSSKIVQIGPFKHSRNPMYLGFILLLLGIAILFGSLIVFLAPVGFFIIINFFFIPFEERLMEKTFGKEYLDYKNKVRRWI